MNANAFQHFLDPPILDEDHNDLSLMVILILTKSLDGRRKHSSKESSDHLPIELLKDKIDGTCSQGGQTCRRGGSLGRYLNGQNTLWAHDTVDAYFTLTRRIPTVGQRTTAHLIYQVLSPASSWDETTLHLTCQALPPLPFDSYMDHNSTACDNHNKTILLLTHWPMWLQRPFVSYSGRSYDMTPISRRSTCGLMVDM